MGISGWFRDIYCQLVQRIQLNFPRRAEACTFFRIFFVVTLLLRDGLDSYSVHRHAKVRFFLAHKHAASALFSINGLLLSWLRTRFSRRWAGSSAARIPDYLRRTGKVRGGPFIFTWNAMACFFRWSSILSFSNLGRVFRVLVECVTRHPGVYSFRS